MKVPVIVASLILPISVAFAQAPETPPVAAKPKRAQVTHVAHPPAQTSAEVLDVNQILGIRQVDPATYEIDTRLQSGEEVHLRMNAFVMQSLGMQLGTYGKQ